MSLSINNTTYDHLHFIGIFGIGMSAIAQYLAPQCTISGSDRSLHNEDVQDIEEGLLACGCTLFDQDGSGISPNVQAVVVSTAIEDTNPDIAAARKLGIPVLHRSEVLAAIVAQSRTISVTGTSGKSSVSAMIFHVLHEAGLEASYIGGAKLHALKDENLIGNAYRGSGDLLVIEADESDGTVIHYHPEISVLLNVSKDHKEIAEVVQLLTTAAQQSQHVIKNGDDVPLASLEGLTFGLGATNDVKPLRWSTSATASTFTIDDTTFVINQPGEHTILNGLATVATARALKVADSIIVDALASYRGIERRFDCYAAARGCVVIDDYAHNPEKIAAAIKAAQLVSPRVTAVFQPHGFGPLAFMFDDLVALFGTILRPADRLFVLPVFYVGGTVQATIDSDTLVAAVNNPSVHVTTKEGFANLIQTLPDETAVILLGARDPGLPAYAQLLAQRIAP